MRRHVTFYVGRSTAEPQRYFHFTRRIGNSIRSSHQPRCHQKTRYQWRLPWYFSRGPVPKRNRSRGVTNQVGFLNRIIGIGHINIAQPAGQRERRFARFEAVTSLAAAALPWSLCRSSRRSPASTHSRCPGCLRVSSARKRHDLPACSFPRTLRTSGTARTSCNGRNRPLSIEDHR